MVAKKEQATRTKAGSSSRFGARYSAKHRHTIARLDETKKHQVCPRCEKKSLNRHGFKWVCTKCKAEVVGGQYTVKTPLGIIADQIIGKQLTKEELEKMKRELELLQGTREIIEEKPVEEKKERKHKETIQEEVKEIQTELDEIEPEEEAEEIEDEPN